MPKKRHAVNGEKRPNGLTKESNQKGTLKHGKKSKDRNSRLRVY